MISMSDFSRIPDSEQVELEAATLGVLRSGWFIHGENCREFEAEFAGYLGVGHVVGVANGTDALRIALAAVGVGRGSKVAVAANAGFYSTAALLALGATPVFVDVDRVDHLMSPTALAEVLAQGGVDALVVTHLYGRLADMDALLAEARPAGVFVVEDCAQAHGAERDGIKAGGFADIAAFSFYPTKNLGALGDAGAVSTNDAGLADKVRTLRQYGWSEKYVVASPGGGNSRLDEIQAAFLRIKLRGLAVNNRRRVEIAARYSAEINHPLVQCPNEIDSGYVAHLFVVVCDDRNGLAAHLASQGVGSDVHYPVPDHKQPILPDYGTISLPATEYLAARVLSLPCHPYLDDQEVDLVISAVNSWKK